MAQITTLVAFHGKAEVKEMYVSRVQLHAAHDEIIQGQYWEHGRGCAVGCTIHGNEHSRYESELGIPRQLAYLQDRIFEGLSNEEAKGFPLAFLAAIHVGADLSLVVSRFMVWMLADEKDGVIRFAKRDETKAAIQKVADLYKRQVAGETISEKEWRSDAYAAYAAADAAYAAYAAAYAAADAAYAAYAAAAAAADAADADAAYAADAAAADAAYAADADDDARKEHFKAMRDELLRLLASA